MRNRKQLKVKMIGKQLVELAAIYYRLIGGYKPEDEHEQLLLEHAVSLWNRLDDMVEREQEKYTLPLTACEALAFTQLWATRPQPLIEYHRVIIDGVIGKLDQTSKNQRRLNAV